MGKRIIQRARGKGGPPYKSPSHRFPGKISYNFTKADVIDIVHDPCRDAPLAKIMSDKGEKLIVAAEGLKVGDVIDKEGNPTSGNIMTLNKIPKGTFVFGLETRPGSGPKLCLSAGTKAFIVSNDDTKAVIQMPSKQFKTFNPKCHATVGVPAGGGMREKPFVKAGQNFYKNRARNKLWPRTSGVKMNAVDHPFGGRTKPGTPKTISRNAPPGAKVGSIAARRSGKRKK
ncbi:MAG: 50S ribosomal protein L2 [Candidatus Aenigmarchaeota archaeon]|nr:50S ribosomal protein L2 [Candidatus Aenigmarchaeota archaeon]